MKNFGKGLGYGIGASLAVFAMMVCSIAAYQIGEKDGRMRCADEIKLGLEQYLKGTGEKLN